MQISHFQSIVICVYFCSRGIDIRDFNIYLTFTCKHVDAIFSPFNPPTSMQEFIFKKKDLQVLLQEPGENISFKIIYEPLDPSRKEFRAYIEATSATNVIGASVRGCPNPPGCD